MVTQNQLEQTTISKQYYLNKPLKHLSNQFIGQVDVNNFTDLVIGLKGAGKTVFIDKVCQDIPQHWRLCIINAKNDLSHLIDLLLDKFELLDDCNIKNQKEKQQYLYDRFKQAIQLGLKIVIIIDSAEELRQEHLKLLQPILSIVKLVLVATPKIENILHKNQDSGMFYKGNIISFGLLDLDDIAKYIKRRLANISYQGRFPFTSEDIEKIYQISKGNPFLVKALTNQGLQYNNIPLPPLAETRSIYNDLKKDIDLSEYTDLNKIAHLKEVHHLIREKKTVQKAPNKKINSKLTLLLVVFLGFSFFTPPPHKSTLKTDNTIEDKTLDSTIHPETNQHIVISKPNEIPNADNFMEDNAQTKNHTKILEKSKIQVNELPATAINGKIPPLTLEENSLIIVTDKTTNSKLSPPLSLIARKNEKTLIQQQNKMVGIASQKKIKGQKWIKEQPDNHFSIQLLGSSDYNKLLKSLNTLNIELPLGVIRIKKGGKVVWYSAIAGSYKTKKEARKAIKKLPKTLKKNKPWPRDFRGIKNSL